MTHKAETSPTPAALVTGAGSGIGREIARLLHAEGYALALVGRRESALAETRETLGDGPAVELIPSDIADAPEAAAIVSDALARLGRLDVLINNAGYAPMKPIHETDGDETERIFAVNTLGPIATIRAAIPIMLKAGGGSIVTTTSVAGEDPFPGLSVYGAAKAAMNTLSKGLANEYGEQGLRAYAVAPGAVETAMLRSIVSEDMIPTSATLSPAEVAAVIVDAALGKRDEPNGATITVNNA
ncbi:MAG: SDR family oxidoreductase [Planctomycetota bacterium]